MAGASVRGGLRQWTAVLVAAAVVAGLAALGSPLAVLLPFMGLFCVLVFRTPDPALTFTCVGLVTLSWDRISVVVGPMTLKVTYVAFFLAAVAEVTATARSRRRVGPPAQPAARSRLWLLCGALGGLMALLVISAIYSGHVVQGVRQIVVIVVGVVIPTWVTFSVARSPQRRRTALKWTLIGAGLVAALAVYQFTATYLPLPTVFAYEGFAENLARTAGFSYEPAFFAMYLLSLLPLTLGLVLERGPAIDTTTREWRGVLLFLILFAVLLANARAGYVTLLVILLAMAASRRLGGSTLRLVGTVAGVLLAVVALSVVTGFNTYEFVQERITSIADTQEAASNAPRLRLYTVSSKIAREHLPLGIGPGNLGDALRGAGWPLSTYNLGGVPGGEEPPEWRIVANNIWIQAVLDAGVLSVVGVALVLFSLFRVARGSEDPWGRRLALGCLFVLLIGGMLTSIFWDVKVWALIGLAMACDCWPSTRSPGAAVAERVPAYQAAHIRGAVSPG